MLVLRGSVEGVVALESRSMTERSPKRQQTAAQPSATPSPSTPPNATKAEPPAAAPPAASRGRAAKVDGRTSLETGESHQRFPTVSKTDPAKIKALAIDIARLLSDDKCEDIAVLEVMGLSQVTDYLIIASGSSDRQMRSAGDDVEKLGEKLASKCFRKDIDDRTTWVVLDFVDLVVHIFEPNTRAHYDLEMHWSDAPRVDWQRPDQVNRDRAGIT